MTDLQRPEIKKSSRIPFWRDVRVLGVLGQIAFIVLAVLFFRTLGNNFIDNIGKLGKAQFVCRDGTSSLMCAFDFMETEAGFEISETLQEYHVTDSYWRALGMGVLNTFRVAILAILLSTILGTLIGIARLSKNWLISTIVKAYVELIRNTPLLIQIVVIYFVAFLTLPPVTKAIQPMGLPLFLSQRNISYPEFEFMPSAAIFLAFLFIGLIQFQVLWLYLGRQEEKTGKSSHRLTWSLLSAAVIAVIGWNFAGNMGSSESILSLRSTRIRDFKDVQAFILKRAQVEHISELQGLPKEKLDEAALRICVQQGSKSEPNLIYQLEKSKTPFQVVTRTRYAYQAAESYKKGECDILAAQTSVLAAELALIDKPQLHMIVPISQPPAVWSRPRLEKGNIVGGSKISPEFAGLLVALVLYASAFISEIVRAGIQSVTKGQLEAATALGLSDGQRLRLVVLPQALRVIIPPLISEYLGTIKDSSLGIAIGFPDLYSVANTIINQSGRSLQVIITIMAAYLAMSLITSAILNWYNNKVRFVER